MDLAWPAAPPSPGLAPGDVHVFAVWVGGPADPGLWSCLSPDERERAERLRVERARQHFVGARAALRRLAAAYLGLEPSAVRFAYGERGKPSLEGGRSLRFNVSHSAGLALLAFARDLELGVDVERQRVMEHAERIAERHFRPRETATLRGLDEPEKTRAFFRCWTRKEAFLKATGQGLSLPLQQVEVTLAPGQPAALRSVPRHLEPLVRWGLTQLDPAPGFSAALATEGRPERVACWRLEAWDSRERVASTG